MMFHKCAILGTVKSKIEIKNVNHTKRTNAFNMKEVHSITILCCNDMIAEVNNHGTDINCSSVQQFA